MSLPFCWSVLIPLVLGAGAAAAEEDSRPTIPMGGSIEVRHHEVANDLLFTGEAGTAVVITATGPCVNDLTLLDTTANGADVSAGAYDERAVERSGTTLRQRVDVNITGVYVVQVDIAYNHPECRGVPFSVGLEEAFRPRLEGGIHGGFAIFGDEHKGGVFVGLAGSLGPSLVGVLSMRAVLTGYQEVFADPEAPFSPVLFAGVGPFLASDDSPLSTGLAFGFASRPLRPDLVGAGVRLEVNLVYGLSFQLFAEIHAYATTGADVIFGGFVGF